MNEKKLIPFDLEIVLSGAKKTFWTNVYKDSSRELWSGYWYDSAEKAKDGIDSPRYIKTISIELDESEFI